MTMVVYQQNTLPFAPDEVLGVAIGTPNLDDLQQRHVGFIYQIDDSGPRFCHLAWHYTLKDEPLPPDYCWGPSGLDGVNKTVMAAYVALLKQNARDVPYSIDYDDEVCYFDHNGRYIAQPIGRGLTCATFILTVFSQLGFKLIEAPSWPKRPDDAQWQQQIISVLTQCVYASPEHIEAVKQQVGAQRFRPEEAAAGVISEDIPLDFSAAHALAQEILRDINGNPANSN
jgi:hypothetical protein